MIGIVDVEVQALNPSMPLYPMRAFVSSPSSIRVRNVPKRIGKWCIENVSFVVAYPDGSIKSANCVLVGGVWTGTIEGTQTSGTSTNGYTIYASGTDENGQPVSGYVLGKGDIEILEADGTLTPGETHAYVHLLSAESATPKEGDLYPTLSGYMIWQDGEAHALVETPDHIEDEDGSYIYADRSFLTRKHHESWVVTYQGAEYVLSGEKTDASQPLPTNPQIGDVAFRIYYDSTSASYWTISMGTFTSIGVWAFIPYGIDGSEDDTHIVNDDPEIIADWQKVYEKSGVLASEDELEAVKDDVGDIEQALSGKQDTLTDAQITALDQSADAILTQIVVDNEWKPRKYLAPSSTFTKNDLAAMGIWDATNNTWLHVPKAVQFGSNVTSTSTQLFKDCTQLRTVIGNTIQTIAATTFSGCSGLTRVTLPASVSIGTHAFKGVNVLTAMTIPPTTIAIGRNSFQDCSQLTLTFEEKPLTEVQAMTNYPWGLNANQITADKTATQSWVEGKNYATTTQLADKRDLTDMDVRGLPTGEGSWFMVNDVKLAWNGNRWGNYQTQGMEISYFPENPDPYDMFIGDNEFAVFLDSQFTFTKTIGDNTYEIVGYAGVLATDSWVKEQNYLSAVPDTYKTYNETVSSLSGDGYATTSQIPVASSQTPVADTALGSAGNVSTTTYSRSDHSHPVRPMDCLYRIELGDATLGTTFVGRVMFARPDNQLVMMYGSITGSHGSGIDSSYDELYYWSLTLEFNSTSATFPIYDGAVIQTPNLINIYFSDGYGAADNDKPNDMNLSFTRAVVHLF